MTPTLPQVLQYLMTGGAVALAAAFASWAAENWPWYQKLVAAAKQALMVAVCLVLSLGAWAILNYVPAETLQALSVPFGIAVATVAALMVNQAWHQLVNKANPTVSAGEPIAVTQVPAEPTPKP